MASLDKLTKVSESFTVYRYDNGYMFEVTGRDKKEDWKNLKIICNTQDDVVALFQDYIFIELRNGALMIPN